MLLLTIRSVLKELTEWLDWNVGLLTDCETRNRPEFDCLCDRSGIAIKKPENLKT